MRRLDKDDSGYFLYKDFIDLLDSGIGDETDDKEFSRVDRSGDRDGRRDKRDDRDGSRNERETRRHSREREGDTSRDRDPNRDSYSRPSNHSPSKRSF